MTLQKLVEEFKDVDYSRVTRNEQAYADTIALTTSELTRLVDMYKQGGNLQHLRLLRDSIDHWIRRYHGYTIGGSIGTHYVEVGLPATVKGIFEHVIPASKLRDMLINGTLTINQALNAPISRVSSLTDHYLRNEGLVSTNNDYWHFFRRYSSLTACTIELEVEIQTHDGKAIDLDKWTLQDHYNYFGVQ